MQLGKEITSPQRSTRRHNKPDAVSFSCLFVLLRGRTLAWLMMPSIVSSPTARPSNPAQGQAWQHAAQGNFMRVSRREVVAIGR